MITACQIRYPAKVYRILGHPVDAVTGMPITTLVRAEMIEPYEQGERIYNIYIFQDWREIARRLEGRGQLRLSLEA